MTRACWWFVETASRLLDPVERDVVRGDIQESGESAPHAIRDVTGLVFRRQVALWNNWQPWVVLIAVVIPLGMLLSLLARSIAESSSIYSFLYLNNWTWSFLTIPGARRDLLNYSVQFLLDFISLVCWSWTTGFVLGALSRRAVWVNGVLLLCIAFGEFLLIPQPHHGRGNDPVFDLEFYRVVFPAFLRVFLVGVPTYLGMCSGFRRVTIALPSAILLGLAVVLLTARAAGTVQMAAILGWWHFNARVYGAGLLLEPSWQLRLLPLALTWPAAYMLGSAGWKRWRSTLYVD